MSVSDSQLSVISVEYDPARVFGKLSLEGEGSSSIWARIVSRLIDEPDGRQIDNKQIEFPWATVLSFLREYGTKSQQMAFDFRFRLVGDAKLLVAKFAEEVKVAREARTDIALTLNPQEVRDRLLSAGFSRRKLTAFQERDIVHLLSLPHGANFSVPGAGKTTVTLALSLLVRRPNQHLLVIGPKTSFPAWMSVVDECIDCSSEGAPAEQFTILDGSAVDNERLLQSGATRFLMSYDLMVRQQATVVAYLARQPVHVVLDEAHRMKAGLDSQRGAFLLNIAPLIARRDILTGTPMPQGSQDIASQLAFLWPGHGLDLQIQRGTAPREVLGELYVRTTKSELGLPEAKRHFVDVEMAPGQQALYGIVRNETLRRLVMGVRGGRDSIDFLGARRSVMRLLQLSVNPVLALKGISEDIFAVDSGVVDAVLEEGPSSKMRAVVDHARLLAASGKKTVIWTIFTESIKELEVLLADLNPVSLYGAIPSGSSDDLETREGRLKRFHQDDECKVLIGNPAAAGEGISLHTVCHDAIYLDRSYVSTHYLQSIDRIHRLGLSEDIETNIFIYRTKAPAQLGSVDYSVSRRLVSKIRGLQELLDDPDLKKLAFDEENADDPVDYSIDLQDIVDLVEELEGRKTPPLEEVD